jgi:hypothetical protein
MSGTQEAKDRGEGRSLSNPVEPNEQLCRVGDRGAAVCVEGDKERPRRMSSETQSHRAAFRVDSGELDDDETNNKVAGTQA